MATARAVHLKRLRMCLFFVSYLFFQSPIPCSVVGPVALAAHLTRPSLPQWSLFEKALVEEMGAAGESLVLQTEEQVPEVDTCDALPRGPGARRPAGERRARRWSLPVPDQQEGSGHRRGGGGAFVFSEIAQQKDMLPWIPRVTDRTPCSTWRNCVLPQHQRKRMENPETSSSSWGRWQPEPSGWPPFVSAEPAPAAASKKNTTKSKQPVYQQDTPLSSRLTSFAFCFRRNCSGSSCRDLDCTAKKDFEVRAGQTPGSMLKLMKWR